MNKDPKQTILDILAEGIQELKDEYGFVLTGFAQEQHRKHMAERAGHMATLDRVDEVLASKGYGKAPRVVARIRAVGQAMERLTYSQAFNWTHLVRVVEREWASPYGGCRADGPLWKGDMDTLRELEAVVKATKPAALKVTGGGNG